MRLILDGCSIGDWWIRECGENGRDEAVIIESDGRVYTFIVNTIGSFVDRFFLE